MDTELLTVYDIDQHLRQRVGQALTELGVLAPTVELAPPPQPELGDFGFPCFALAKVLRKAPPLIAQEVAARITPDRLIDRVTTDKAYVNLHLRRDTLVQIVLGQILREKERYGAGQAPVPQRVMVEFSSPNTNKPLHLGHLRNNVLGWSISTILEHFGHQVTRVNLVNDRGVHICKSMLAYQKWGQGADPQKRQQKGDHLVGDMYVRFDRQLTEEYQAWQQSEAGQEQLAQWLASEAGQEQVIKWLASPAGQEQLAPWLNSPEGEKHRDELKKNPLGRQTLDWLASPARKQQQRFPQQQQQLYTLLTQPLGQRMMTDWLASPAGREHRDDWLKTGAHSWPGSIFFAEYKDTYFNTASPLGLKVRQMLRQWEEGDPEVLALWRQLNGWVLAGFEETYARLGVRFDEVQVESQTYKLGKEIVEHGLTRGVLTRLADGAVVCDLQQVGLKGEKVLLRSDGTSVYMTQDLGTAVERFQRFSIDRLIYVVGDEQIYHFDVLFRILGLLYPEHAQACHHLAYGMIRLPEGKMKSREGTVVDADDLMAQMHELAREETQARSTEGKAHTEGISVEELTHRAEHIAQAAIKYYLLKFTPRKAFEYDPKESIDFLGQTGPYCLFNTARTCSLLRRAGGEPPYDPEALSRLGTPQELELVHKLRAFPEIVARAAQTLDPSRITEYLFDLCKSFAFIFTDKANHPIVTCEDETLRRARLLLVAGIGYTLRAGLGLLGIQALEEM